MSSRKSKLLLETDLIHPFGFDESLIFQNFPIEGTRTTTMIFVQNQTKLNFLATQHTGVEEILTNTGVLPRSMFFNLGALVCYSTGGY